MSLHGSVDLLVVVSGIPGSGKTTLARRLAPALGLPLLAKDTIKEALLDALGSGDLAHSRRLGGASHEVLLAVAAESPQAVLESFFWPGVAEPRLIALGRPLVQVWCRCPLDLAIARYRDRTDDPDRHPGHRPEHQDARATEHWMTAEPRPLDIDPLISVDTDRPVDIDALIADIHEASRR
ncbi:MAG: AAA family ATPase [Acidimicrobiales bacterium]